MIIVFKKDATKNEINDLIKRVKKLGLKAMVSRGEERTIVGVIGPEDIVRLHPLDVLPGVDKVMPVLAPYKLVSREFKKENSIIKIREGIEIGSEKIAIIAGPCSIESESQIDEIAGKIKEGGAGILRGGAFKPRSSPYTFQGLGEEGLKMLKAVSDKFNIPTATEVMDTRDVDLVAKYTDILQIGARNMQNFNLLKEVGQTKKPIILKRGLSATIKELLMSAEYILSEGNFNVILCERGIRTFEEFTRNTLDLSAVPSIKMLSHLPVIVDPSHACGKWGLVAPLSKAAVACGTDGLLLEVHSNPKEALSDGSQQLLPENFNNLVGELRSVAKAVGRQI
ncbi:MAG: 3-deoxy-7-phosphoheptulonate synthase [Candidatus Omnitrophica bacterium]|nr:3-deoxy-7-phosphoheptulonate synthase [Candidatus Omnitrophota bacterium]